MNGWEIVLLALIAVFVLGPDRLPEYAAKLAHGIRRLRVMAEGAKDQLKDQLGPEYEDINWRQYDPRQYDPRRIVKEALLDPLDEAIAPVRGEIDSVRSAASRRDTSEVADDGATTDPAADSTSVTYDDPDTTTTYDDPDAGTVTGSRGWDPARPVPWDVDAT